MVNRYLSTKFGVISLHAFWENGFYNRADDERPREDSYTVVQ